MKRIFEEVNLNGLKLKNRLIRSATWEGLADGEGHMPEKLYAIYEGLAKGGVGCIITGFTTVSDTDRYFGGIARLSNDGLIPEHKRLTDIARAENCKIIAQLALGEYNRTEPDYLTDKDIADIISLFVKGAQRARKAGYDGVQIHAAHGFFLSRFISPASNHRQDKYSGGSSKIIIDIMNGIRQAAPDLHITMKINCDDFIPNGLTPEMSMEICKQCAAAGIDSIEVSGNGTSVPNIRAGVNEAYFKDFALKLADETSVPVILVGGHRSIDNMEKILNEGKIECLSLSRPLVREPDLPKRWQGGDLAPSKCISCNMCYRTPAHECIFKIKSKNQE
ncbi:MAG: NADH:flavin oxidoreductase [Clostridia bacterium]|nr:NADH:flavin oxidoreductase [Clostridia bacterium]